MTPLDWIKQGITEGCWESVCKGYETLTGDIIPIPPRPLLKCNLENALRDISDLVIHALDPNKSMNMIKKILPQESVTKTVGKNKNVGRPKKDKRKNGTINEDGEDSSLELDPSQITPMKAAQEKLGESQLITNIPDPDEVKKNLAKAKRTTRVRRESPKKYKAECSECSSKFDSNRPTGEIGQKCPNCLKANKGRF